MDAPDIIDDFCLNLMDWSSSNVLALALQNTVYLWDASNGSASELVTVDDENGPVTSVSWVADGILQLIDWYVIFLCFNLWNGLLLMIS